MTDYMVITKKFDIHCSLAQFKKCLKCNKLYTIVEEPSEEKAVIICKDIYSINPLEREDKKVFCKHHKLEDYKEVI